MDGGIDKQ